MNPIRNPFQRGDRVVPTGFKAGDDRYPFRVSNTRLRWAHENAVLTVNRASPTYVMAGTGGISLAYYPAELRMATAEEIAEADTPKAPEQPPLAKGMVIKAEDTSTVMIVADPKPNCDGYIRVIKLGDQHGIYFRAAQGYTVLGQMMPDGDFRPAA